MGKGGRGAGQRGGSSLAALSLNGYAPPMDEETAMSPSPCLATMTEVRRSGTEVPAARMVTPMITSGMPTCTEAAADGTGGRVRTSN